MQHRVLLVRCCPGALSQYAAKPLIAGIGTTSLANTSAFGLPGQRPAQDARWPSDGNGSIFGPTSARIAASLCFDARYCLQQSVRFLELFRAEPRPDLTVQGFYRHLKEIVVAKSAARETGDVR